MALIFIGLIVLLALGSYYLFTAWVILQESMAYSDGIGATVGVIRGVIGVSVWFLAYWLVPFKIVMPAYS